MYSQIPYNFFTNPWGSWDLEPDLWDPPAPESFSWASCWSSLKITLDAYASRLFWYQKFETAKLCKLFDTV